LKERFECKLGPPRFVASAQEKRSGNRETGLLTLRHDASTASLAYSSKTGAVAFNRALNASFQWLLESEELGPLRLRIDEGFKLNILYSARGVALSPKRRAQVVRERREEIAEFLEGAAEALNGALEAAPLARSGVSLIDAAARSYSNAPRPVERPDGPLIDPASWELALPAIHQHEPEKSRLRRATLRKRIADQALSRKEKAADWRRYSAQRLAVREAARRAKKDAESGPDGLALVLQSLLPELPWPWACDCRATIEKDSTASLSVKVRLVLPDIKDVPSIRFAVDKETPALTMRVASAQSLQRCWMGYVLSACLLLSRFVFDSSSRVVRVEVEGYDAFPAPDAFILESPRASFSLAREDFIWSRRALFNAGDVDDLRNAGWVTALRLPELGES